MKCRLSDAFLLSKPVFIRTKEVLEDHRLHYTERSKLAIADSSGFKLYTHSTVLVALSAEQFDELVACIPSPDQANSIASRPFLCIAPIDRATVAPYVTDAAD